MFQKESYLTIIQTIFTNRVWSQTCDKTRVQLVVKKTSPIKFTFCSRVLFQVYFKYVSKFILLHDTSEHPMAAGQIWTHSLLNYILYNNDKSELTLHYTQNENPLFILTKLSQKEQLPLQ